MISIDVRDKFALKRAGNTICTGSLITCRAEVIIMNGHAAKLGHTPDYWVGFNEKHEGFRDLLKHAESLGLRVEMATIFNTAVGDWI